MITLSNALTRAKDEKLGKGKITAFKEIRKTGETCVNEVEKLLNTYRLY